MCWNTAVSLNTFLFSGFVLLLVIYNNAYTQYKIPGFNIWVYLFFASFIVMQLIEFFIWKNINNSFYNQLFSILASLLLLFQPIFSLMMITNKKIRNILVLFYSIIALPYAIYNFSTINPITVKGESGHLRWQFFNATPLVLIVWLFFFLFPFVYGPQWMGIGGLFGCIVLAIAFYNYKQDNTMWSMWCWMVNIIMIYLAGYLLFYLPFYYNNKSIC